MMVGDTYIIKTVSGEYYCGFTNDIIRRINQHKKEKYPHWFCNKSRKEWFRIVTFKGNFERDIKRFGVKKFFNIFIKFELYGHDDFETDLNKYVITIDELGCLRP